LEHEAEEESVLDELEADKEAVLEPPTHKESKGAPHRFVNFHNLKNVIESELGPCKHCKNKERSLEQTQNVNFATTFEIYYKPCTVKKEQERLEIVYLKRKINKLHLDAKEESFDQYETKN